MKNFRNIILLMLVALLALIAFQWYWIQNAIAVKKEQFDSKVVEAMNATVAKVEKQEVIFLAKQKLREQEKKRLEALSKPRYIKRKKAKKIEPAKIVKNTPIPAFTKDSLKSLVKNRMGKDTISLAAIASPQDLAFLQDPSSDIFVQDRQLFPQQQMRFLKKMIEDQNRFWAQFDQNRGMVQRAGREVGEIVRMLDSQFQRQQQPRPPHMDPYYQSQEITFEAYFMEVDSLGNIAIKPKSAPELPKTTPNPAQLTKTTPKEVVEEKEEEVEIEYLTKTKNKAELVKDVFTDILQGDRNIYERVNQQMLDTLLREELYNRGIDTPYEYGVKNNEKMIFTSYEVNYNPNLADMAYNVRLFPNDSQQQEQFLYLYFPERDEVIMGNMNSVFGSSIALILLIAGIFYASVHKMMQQKKLSIIKNDFINNMTHEFKTPISTISLAVQVMKDPQVQKSEEKTERYLNIINDENSRLGGQVEKVLQMALLEQSKVSLNKQEVDLHDIIEQVAQNHSVQIEQKQGSLKLDLDAQASVLYADEVHLTNIVHNLIDNAVKYSKEKPEISIHTKVVDDQFCLSISDKGIGMSKEQVSKIFDKFYRVTSGNLHDVKGFGLGLSYVKKILDLHHADIQVASEPSVGTTFSLYFSM